MSGDPGVFAGELVPATPATVGELLDWRAAPDPVARLVDLWIVAVTGATPSVHTIRAYRADMRAWLGWCTEHGVDPLGGVTRSHVDLYAKILAAAPTSRTGRPPTPATVARRLSAIASWYAFLVDEDVVERVPVRSAARPAVPAISTTRGLTQVEAKMIRRRLAVETPTERAIALTLLTEGLRVSELIETDVGDRRSTGGHVALTVMGKGRKPRELVLSAPVVDAIDVMLDQRAERANLPDRTHLDPDGPLFLRVGGGRWTQQSVLRMLQRICRAAGISDHRAVTPHTLRHACATLMLAAGTPLHVVRDVHGHASTRTTERYDRARGQLDRTGAAVHALTAYTQPDPED